MFRSGMELGVMNRSLSLLAKLRRTLPLREGLRSLGLLHWLSKRLLPFGTDRGGMVVQVVGRVGSTMTERRWTLLAEAAQGPYIPGIAVRSLLRRDQLRPGARPCLAEFTLIEAEAAMSDLTIRTEVAPTSCWRSFKIEGQSDGSGRCRAQNWRSLTSFEHTALPI
ncbi:hypothetical protein ACW9UQ_10630, partial [Halovulum sp. GXIMD14793]